MTFFHLALDSITVVYWVFFEFYTRLTKLNLNIFIINFIQISLSRKISFIGYFTQILNSFGFLTFLLIWFDTVGWILVTFKRASCCTNRVTTMTCNFFLKFSMIDQLSQKFSLFKCLLQYIILMNWVYPLFKITNKIFQLFIFTLIWNWNFS